MDPRTRARIVVATVTGTGAVVLAGLGLATVYGFAVEYGGGSFTDLAFLVVPIPALAVAVAVVVWPRLATRVQLGVVLGTVAAMVAGGLAADELGRRENRERLLAASKSFTCNGPNAEITLPAAVDRTWRELPREAPVYGPIAGSRADCLAAVAGNGERTFADYTAAFRDLDGWTVRVDRPGRFVMVREDVAVTVRTSADDITTIRVGVRR